MSGSNVLYLSCRELFTGDLVPGAAGLFRERVHLSSSESLCMAVRNRVANALQVALWRVEVTECEYISQNHFDVHIAVYGLFDDVSDYVVRVRSVYGVRIV